jgi:phage major head subunit gpT-like protein
MGAELLSSRAVIGRYYQQLEVNPGASWMPFLTNYFTSDQPSETYVWLGMSPQMREWIGGRQAKGFRENSISIKNKHFESTLELLKRDATRDKTGQIMVRVADLAKRTQSHWASLVSSLIVGGATSLCYDGQYFFDTDHSEGASGTQSNKVSVDVSALPTQVHGTTTAPSVEEMQQCILQAIAAIKGYVDDQGEPMNEDANQFLVMVPTSLWLTAEAATKNNVLTSNAINLIPGLTGIQVTAVENARLNASWTDTFCVFRGDGATKPFIRQEEQGVVMKAKAEGSEYEFDNDAWQFGVDTWRNVGMGYWQHACQIIMT